MKNRPAQKRSPDRAEAGFTLVEVIVSLILVGIVGLFSTFFLAEGIEAYVRSRLAVESAFKAQVAMDRIRMELITVDTLAAAPILDTSIQYTSTDDELTGTRKLHFRGGALWLNVDGTDYTLIDGIADPLLEVQYADMDNDSVADEVAYIDVGFTIGDQPAYSVRIYPRRLVNQFV